MSVITFRHVNWAAQECYFQHSGEMSVAWMLNGFRFAHRRRKRAPRLADILLLSRLVEPRANSGKGFRRHDVKAGGQTKMSYFDVPEAMDRLLEYTPTPPTIEEIARTWFKQYEDIHPLGDGNGRTGSILYNWMRGSLDHPIHPPNFWDETLRNYNDYPEPIM